MQELTVISGKGGTGKTSIVGSLAALTDNIVVADCDVDAPDLHCILEPEVVHREEFSGGLEARISLESCTACGKCEELCRFSAVIAEVVNNGKTHVNYRIDHIACEGCGVCTHFCPEGAIELSSIVNGHLFVSMTRCGPMVHAQLGVAAENSGKLVTRVRDRARQLAERRHSRLTIVDGPPGIGCPVIAALTGASLVLVVTEPTLSGAHDLERVLQLANHFGVPTAVSVNKWDLNPALAEQIECKADTYGAGVTSRVRYDRQVTEAQTRGQAAVEIDCPAAADIRRLWRDLRNIGGRHGVRF